MKLSTKAIKKMNQSTVLKIAAELGFTERWIYKLMAANRSNSPLTTYAAVRIIRENTGLKDADILKDGRKLKKRRAEVHY